MQQYGNEEAADIYVWTKEQGVKKLLDCEHYAYCNIVSDCHVGASTSIMMKNQIVYHLKNEEGRCLLYALSMDGRDICLTPKANVIRDIAVSAQGWYTLEMEENALEEIYYRKRMIVRSSQHGMRSIYRRIGMCSQKKFCIPIVREVYRRAGFYIRLTMWKETGIRVC